ncbi:MAG: HNH endonuclease [Candidatus Accumulibacter sp.]|uniref:HNH endonuclease n=1 Tax=Accumulibacter sp. TaxID=2053492 RepID=UPI0025910738|nr:HNH endonuclease [Accumulibacter sp.]MCM8621313.1 HNH endonuclease [Accumulibacter sp.]
MNGEYEQLIRDAFDGLGSYSKLGNGFGLQSGHGQTCAVYFSGNAPGNVVEIGLSPKALAPLLGRTQRELAEWLGSQPAAGRERTISGERGSYPAGLAFVSRRDLSAFLAAWEAFRHGGGDAAVASGGLLATRIEKAAQDAGFDRTPEARDGWLVFRSTAFAGELAVHALAAEAFRVGFSSAAWADKVAADCGLGLLRSTADWPAIVAPVAGYAALHGLLQRAGVVARLLAGEGAAAFRRATQGLPVTTEAERLTVQRVGQDIFRQSLIDYWQGRCAVTGLDVVPLLRASHIKPWAACASDAERLDVFNGLLLAPHLDALFDGGWISFDGDGEVMVCAGLSGEQRALLGLNAAWCLRGIAEGHWDYLVWHRNRVFRDGGAPA